VVVEVALGNSEIGSMAFDAAVAAFYKLNPKDPDVVLYFLVQLRWMIERVWTHDPPYDTTRRGREMA
jgi:hypothetical protein